MKEYYTFSEIHQLLEESDIACGNKKLMVLLQCILQFIPVEIINHIINDCKIIMIERAKLGIYIDSDYIKNKHLIILFDHEFTESNEFAETVFHEIAHFHFKHKVMYSIDDNEYWENEEEADKLAKSFFSKYREFALSTGKLTLNDMCNIKQFM